MKHFTKLLFTALFSALLLSLAVGAASANLLAVNEDEFDIRWTALSFNPTAGGEVICEVTLLGTFHERTITKTSGALIGFIDHAGIGINGEEEECEGGNATVLLGDLPWHVTYQSFDGNLPAIEDITLLLVGAAFQIENELGIPCLVQTDAEEPAVGIAHLEGGRVTELTPDPTVTIASDDPVCAFFGVRGGFSGPGAVENRHGGDLDITLIGI